MRFHKLQVLLCVTVLILAGCKSGPVSTQAYPPTQLSVTAIPSGATPIQAYPVSRTPIPEAVRFQFDRPLKAGMTIVTGSAPAGVVVNILNVTLMGELLGSGVVDSNNRFAITVAPLPASIRIGIEVADTGSSGRAYEDFYNEEYKGEGASALPQVGYFQDTVMVEP